ncbi:MAG: hypothetical protein AAFV53_31595 [Myxococcota bacterium]
MNTRILLFSPLVFLLMASSFAPSFRRASRANHRFLQCPPPGTPPEDPRWVNCPAEGELQPKQSHDGSSHQDPGLIFTPDIGDTQIDIPPPEFQTLSQGGYLVPDVGYDDAAGRVGGFSVALAESATMTDHFDEADWTISSGFSGDYLGASLVEVGDSGVSVGAPGYDMVVIIDDVVSGDYDVDLDGDSFIFGDTGTWFGAVQTVAGDLNAISAPATDDGGTVFLVSVPDAGSTMVDDAMVSSITGNGDGGLFGYRSVAGDFNGDGEDDIAISDPNNDAVYLFFGDLADLGTVSTADADATLTGAAGSAAGIDLDMLLDADGAVTHLLVGAPGDNTAYVVDVDAAADGGALADIAVAITGDDGAWFGLSVSAFGSDKILVGAPGESTLYAFDRSDSDQTSADTLASVSDEAGFTQMGLRVSAFDMDGDEYADVAVASVSDDGETTRWTTFQSGVMPE